MSGAESRPGTAVNICCIPGYRFSCLGDRSDGLAAESGSPLRARESARSDAEASRVCFSDLDFCSDSRPGRCGSSDGLGLFIPDSIEQI